MPGILSVGRLLGGTILSGAPYSVLNFSPELVAAFNDEYYQQSGFATSFSELITHSASSNATMVDSDGLIKWRPHNLLKYSEQFDNAAWTKSGVTAGADSITEDTSTGNHRVLPLAGISVPAVQHTTVIDVKPNGRTRVKLTNNNLVGSTFDLVGSGSVVSGSGTIIALQDGWYRISSELVSPTTERLVLYLDNGTGVSYTGDGSSGIYIRNAHLYRSDLGGMVNNPDRGDSYVPTTSSAVYLPRRGHHVYNGDTWVNKGLLHESEARVNLVTYSDFSSGWIASGATLTAANSSGLDGNTSAATLIEDTSTGQHKLQSSVAVSSGVTYTWSLVIKANGHSNFSLYPQSGTSAAAVFDLDAVTSTDNVTTNLVGHGIHLIAQGKYLCWITFTTTGTTVLPHVYLRNNAAAASAPTYTGDGASGLIIEATQLEAGPTPSSYIPTSGATVTRAAETLTIPAAKLPWPTPEYVTGTELVTNGTFDTDSDWTKGTGWTIGSGVASVANSGSASYLISPTTTAEVGKTYLATFTISNYSAGNAILTFGGVVGTSRVANGTYSQVLTAASTGQLSIYGGTTANYSIDNISVKEINPLSVSIQMQGEMTYADEDNADQVIHYAWGGPASGNRIVARVATNSTKTGDPFFDQNEGANFDFVTGSDTYYSPSINVPFNIASRHGSTFINGAVDGTALTANTTPVALPNLSATNLQLGYDYMGTIFEFRMWSDDLGDIGIAEASAPSLIPSLSLTFDGQPTSFTDGGLVV